MQSTPPSSPFSRRSFVSTCTASVAAVAATMNERFALAEEAAARIALETLKSQPSV
jgi:hypothetical protein